MTSSLILLNVSIWWLARLHLPVMQACMFAALHAVLCAFTTRLQEFACPSLGATTHDSHYVLSCLEIVLATYDLLDLMLFLRLPTQRAKKAVAIVTVQRMYAPSLTSCDPVRFVIDAM